MNPAWVGFAGGVIGTLTSLGIAVRQTRESRRLAELNAKIQVNLAQLNSDLAVERDARAALRERDQRAEDVLTRYREPLAAAAFDLQSRCYNILRMSFFGRFGSDVRRSQQAVTTTLFRFAQYYGWTEILRRDVQFLSFPEAEETRRVVQLQRAIVRSMASSKGDRTLMIWVDEQRAIGERMIVQEHDKVMCMGYARFCDEYEERFSPLFSGLPQELPDPAAAPKLRELQHLLCELVETLDRQRVRYTEDLDRA